MVAIAIMATANSVRSKLRYVRGNPKQLKAKDSPMPSERRQSISSRTSSRTDNGSNNNNSNSNGRDNNAPTTANSNISSEQQVNQEHLNQNEKPSPHPQDQKPEQNNEHHQDTSTLPDSQQPHSTLQPVPPPQEVPAKSNSRIQNNTSPGATPRDPQLPVVGAVTSRSSVGLQRVYLEGVEVMRSHVTRVEEEAERISREFHRVTEQSEGFPLDYLKECDESLLQANTDLRKRNVKLEVIDSDTRLVRLLNELRSGKSAQQETIEALTTFWHDLKKATEQYQALLQKFNETVLQRLSHNYISSHNADLKVPVCQQYALDIECFLKDIDTRLGEANLLLTSFGSGLHQDLIQKSEFSERLMVACDVNAFPILGFVHAACAKVKDICGAARVWLARDEQFMHEINTFIRETRPVARRREEVLNSEKQKAKRVEKNVRIAQNILHSNREKLRHIETELEALETKLDTSREEQKVRTSEIHQKESMVDFLKLTLQQTKKNYSLQSKRTKLLRQVKELEDYLRSMESDLELVQDKILAKSHEKILLAEKISTSERSYGALKSDLDSFSENLEKLEAEVSGLSGQLLQLEIVHTMKTSPEAMDNLVDRPSTVKLSRSLKDKIRERRRKAAAKD